MKIKHTQTELATYKMYPIHNNFVVIMPEIKVKFINIIHYTMRIKKKIT